MKKPLSLLLSVLLLLALSAAAFAAEPAKKVETNSGVTVMHAADWKEQFPNQYESWAAPLTTARPAGIFTMSRTSRRPDARTRWPTAGPARRPTLPTW